MTFLEAALEVLKREGKPLHFKDLTDKALSKKLLTFVGRTPELTMQTQLVAAVKKSPGNPFVRVKPGVFGLLRYPDRASLPPEPVAAEEEEKEKETAEAGGRSSEGGEREGRRRRRGGRGRRGRGGERPERPERGPRETTAAAAEERKSDDNDDHDEPKGSGLSAAGRAALAATGVLEAEDSEHEDDEMAGSETESTEDNGTSTTPGLGEPGEVEEMEAGAESDDEGEEEGEEAEEATAEAGAEPGAEGEGARRRRRRRRRRRGGGGEFADSFAGGSTQPGGYGAELGAAGSAPGETSPAIESGPGPENAGEGVSGESAEGEAAVRRIMTPLDAAIEVLRGQPPGRGLHVRQIADTAVRRRLVHGETNEAWRVLRAALAAEPKERLRAGQRPRVRAAGSGLYALSRRPPDMDLERAEHVFGEARRALRERTLASLERRLVELGPGAFEALARVLLQREGFGPCTFVKRVEGTVYLEALRGRGSRPSKCLIALRPGGGIQGRRVVGELRAGVRARGQDEGLLMLAGRLGEDAIAEWKQSGAPVEIADGPAMAETCVRHGLGVVTGNVQVDLVDADFFAELSEG